MQRPFLDGIMGFAPLSPNLLEYAAANGGHLLRLKQKLASFALDAREALASFPQHERERYYAEHARFLDPALASLHGPQPADTLAQTLDEAPSEALELLIRHRDIGPRTKAAIRHERDRRTAVRKELAGADRRQLDAHVTTQTGTIRELAAQELERRALVAGLHNQDEAIRAKDRVPFIPGMREAVDERLAALTRAPTDRVPLRTRAAAAKELARRRRNAERMTNGGSDRTDGSLAGLMREDAGLALALREYGDAHSGELEQLLALLAAPILRLPEQVRQFLIDHRQVGPQTKARVQEPVCKKREIAAALARVGDPFFALSTETRTATLKELVARELEYRAQDESPGDHGAAAVPASFRSRVERPPFGHPHFLDRPRNTAGLAAMRAFASANEAALATLAWNLGNASPDARMATLAKARTEELQVLLFHNGLGPQAKAAIQRELDDRKELAAVLAGISSEFLMLAVEPGNGMLEELVQSESDRRAQVASLLRQQEAIAAQASAPSIPGMETKDKEQLRALMQAPDHEHPLPIRAAAAKELAQRLQDERLAGNKDRIQAAVFLHAIEENARLAPAVWEYAYANAEHLQDLALRLSGEAAAMRTDALDQARSEALEFLACHGLLMPRTKAAIRQELLKRAGIARTLAEADREDLVLLSRTGKGAHKELAEKELNRRPPTGPVQPETDESSDDGDTP